MDGIDSLPNDLNSLKNLLLQAQQQITNQEKIIELKNEQIYQLDEAIKQLLSQKFSASSERWEGQALLFNEAESTAATKPPADEYEEVKAHKRKKRGRCQIICQGWKQFMNWSSRIEIARVAPRCARSARPLLNSLM